MSAWRTLSGEVEYTGYQNEAGEWVTAGGEEAGLVSVKLAAEDVTQSGQGFVLNADSDIRVDSRAHKMSKSRGNVINPDDVISDYGGDSLRLYEMFMGPLRETKVGATRNTSKWCAACSIRAAFPPPWVALIGATRPPRAS